MEASFWHNLGMVYEDKENWEAAEQVYRQAAQLREDQGLLAGGNGVAVTWDHLARVCTGTGRPAEAEQWYRKALAACRAAGDQSGTTRTLNNIAAFFK